MQNLPSAEVYEREFMHMSWGRLTKEVEALVASRVPKGGKVLDLLCGPGYLLGKLQQLRPDLYYVGVDLEAEFIRHARKRYPAINFEIADALTWISEEKFDVVICTAGVHHILFKQQDFFISRLAHFLRDESKGFVIIADPYISDFSTEKERLLACAELGYAYLVETINNDAPIEVIEAAVGILSNDLFGIEWKTSVAKRRVTLDKYFRSVVEHRVWSSEGEYGDYYFVLTP